MPKTDPTLTENLVYSSPRIIDRRRRILEEARNLIAEHGYHGFRMRDLCRVAEVAPHTVYKAFGSKERLIALSLRQYFEASFGRRKFHYPRDTLRGVIELAIVADAGMRRDREFVKAMVDLYFSFSVDDELRAAASHNLRITVAEWVVTVSGAGDLRAGVSGDGLVRDMTNLLFAASFEWCRGKLDDGRYLHRKVEAMLMATAANTQGATCAEAEALLADLRGPEREYDVLVSLAHEAAMAELALSTTSPAA